MRSINFEFLRERNPELSELGAFAEQYAYTDPASCLVKLRAFGENLVLDFYYKKQIQRYSDSTFIELLDGLKGAIPNVVLDKFHLIRRTGNRAAHGESSGFNANTSIMVLKTAFELGMWFNISVYPDLKQERKAFAEPIKPESVEKLRKITAVAQEKIKEQEAQMKLLLDELEAKRLEAQVAKKSAEETKVILEQANSAANVLEFDEEATRKLLIDQMLVQAGWNVGAGGKDTDEVKQEFEVSGQPTSSGKGYVDYVLWDTESGKPLAVVEAKKTVHHADKGHKQATLYADALEAKYGQRPVVFCTNGYEIIIHDDAKAMVGRRIYGFYSMESLRRCIWQTENRLDLSQFSPDGNIVERMYQTRAIKQVCEKYASGRNKALIVQATGTGKTRVSIAISEILIRCKWAKRVLFLCDRRELRKQAYDAFGEFIPSEPKIYINSQTANDRNQSFYFATYQAMDSCFENFDVGFFDLVISDESHRSIYKKFRDLFLYFDSYILGLTATPKNIVTHDTYRFFDCEHETPTAYYSYEEAINHKPPYLTNFKVFKHDTKFIRDGIKYSEMNESQRKELEDQVEEPELVDFEKEAIDRRVFNEDTEKRILRNLMENGIKNASGQHVGKTIIFARGHNHAMFLLELFNKMYPQYMKPKEPFCAVIDNQIDRAEQLIDDFKGRGSNDNLTIAISVDMLDTGIDVPEIVNLVFAKPVKSYVKFWQMIGRGTRLCKDLFGPGRDKKEFYIFDHWSNFEYFGENPDEAPASFSKSLIQKIFETRIANAEASLLNQDLKSFELMTKLIREDINSLPDSSIAIKERWKEIKTLQQDGVIERFDAGVVGSLKNVISELMQWRNFEVKEDAYYLDLLISRLQLSVLKQSSELQDYKDELINQVSSLPINIAQVSSKIEWIDKVKSGQFWISPTVMDLEEIRVNLRGIMQFKDKRKTKATAPLTLNITDTQEEKDEIIPSLEGLELTSYRKKVEKVLNEIFEESEALQKIKKGEPVSNDDIMALSEKVIIRDPQVNIDDLLRYLPNKAGRLDIAIRQIIGLDAEAVNKHFTAFVRKYPDLNSYQINFLELIKNHIARYGSLQTDQLYEKPFTEIHSYGINGIFENEQQSNDLINLIEEMNESLEN